MDVSDILKVAAIIPIVAAAVTVIIAAQTYSRTQKWQQLRFAAEVVDKIYSDDTLQLAIRFLDWHDREMILPERYAQYGDAQGKFHHRVANMEAAMSTANRTHDATTGVYDLKEEYRLPEYVIYVEVFDRLFDYLSQLDTFLEAKLINDKNITPLAYMVRRLDALGYFRAYLEQYEVFDVLALIDHVKQSSNLWVHKPAPQ